MAREAENGKRVSGQQTAAGGRPRDDATLEQVETWLRTQRRESAYAFDAPGKKIWEKHTADFEVEIPAEDHSLLRSKVFTHNHPRGWGAPDDDPLHAGDSFSPEDIIGLAAPLQLAEIRAISPAFRFVMRPGTSGWPPGATLEHVFAIADLAWEQHFIAARRSGTMTIRQMNAAHLHHVWQEVASVLGLVYTREPLSE